MKAPEKIYLQLDLDGEIYSLHNTERKFVSDLEYILSSSSSDSERRGEVSDEEIEVEAKRYSRLLRKLEDDQAESVAYYACINMADWLRSRLTASGGWVDINERKPEKTGDYFITDGIATAIGQYLKKYDCFTEFYPEIMEDNEITHWRELPPAPKTKEK